MWTTAAPRDLSPLYLLDASESAWSLRRIRGVVFTVGVTVLLVLARRSWPTGLTAWSVYAITVAPVLGLTQSGVQTAADRYTYLACLPFALLVAAGVARRPSRSLVSLSVLLVLSLGALTFAQARVWRSSESLWTRAIRVDEDNWLAYHLRGRARMDTGDLEGAIEDFTECIELRPAYAEAWKARSNAHMLRGDRESAFDDAASLVERHVEAGRLGEALSDLERILAAAPADWPRRAELTARLAELRALAAGGG